MILFPREFQLVPNSTLLSHEDGRSPITGVSLGVQQQEAGVTSEELNPGTALWGVATEMWGMATAVLSTHSLNSDSRKL